MIPLHDSHFLLLLDLLLLFLVVLHDLQPLCLDQATLLNVELLLGLQVEKVFSLNQVIFLLISYYLAVHPTLAVGKYSAYNNSKHKCSL